MGFKKAILVLLLLIILTMGAVSANDNVNNLTAVDTQNYTESIVDNIDIVSDEDDEDDSDLDDDQGWESELEYDISVKEKYNIHDLDSELINYNFWYCGNGGNLSIFVDDELCKVYDVEPDEYTRISANDLGLSNLEYKNYTVDVIYSGDNTFEGFNETYVFRGYWGFDVYITEDFDSIDLRYGDSIHIRISIPNDANGNITCTINGRKYSIKPEDLDEDGIFTIGQDKLDYGSNNLEFIYEGDDYPPDSYEFEIDYIATYSIHNWCNFNEPTYIYVNLPADAQGNLDVYEIVDEQYKLLGSVPVENGFANVTLSNLKLGYHEIYPNYTGSDYKVYGEGGSNYDVSLNPIVIANPINVNKPNNNLTFIVPEEYEGILTLTISGEERSVNVTNGIGSIGFFNINSTEYDDEYESFILRYDLRFESGNYTFSRYDSSIRIYDVNQDIVLDVNVDDVVLKGDPIDFSIRNVPEDKNELCGNVTVYIDGQLVFNTGNPWDLHWASSDSSSLDLGQHTIEFYYLGNEIYNPANASRTFEVTDVIIDLNENVYAGIGNSNYYRDYIATIRSIYDGGHYSIVVDDELFEMGFINSDYSSYANQYYDSIRSNIPRGIHDVKIIYTNGNVTKSVNNTVNASYYLHQSNNFNHNNYFREDNLTFNFEVSREVSGNLIVTADKDYIVPIVNGTANLTIPHLERGKYNITVRYDGDEYPELYEVISIGEKLGIYSNSIGYSSMMYGEDLIFVTNLPSDFVGKLYVYEDINNTEVPIQTVDIVDGNARVNVSLDYGTHNIFARIIDYDETKYVFDDDDPDDEDLRRVITGYLNIYQFSIVPPINDLSGYGNNLEESGSGYYSRKLYFGENVTLTVELPSDANGILYLCQEREINNTNEIITLNQFEVINGKSTVFIDDFYKIGSNTFYLKYDDSKYHLFDDLISIKLCPTVTYPDEIVVGDDEYIVVTLPIDANGTVSAASLGDADVENGVARIPLSNLSVGKHYFYITYEGNYGRYTSIIIVYQEPNEYIVVTKPKSFIHISNSSDTLTVELNEDATGDIIVKVGDQFFTKTLEGGRATITGVNLNENEEVQLSYAGDKKYAPIDKNSVKLGESNITSKANADLKVNAADIDEGETAIITFTINTKANGNIMVQVGDANLVATIINGEASVNVDNLKIGKYDVTATYEGNDYVLAENKTVSFNVYSNSTGTFSQLSTLISNTPENGILNLNKDYVKDASSSNEGIVISKAITIDGKGHTIDANHTSRIFKVQAANVTLKNINFINGYCAENGGAIYWSGMNGAVFNCNFINCSSASRGGAIYWNGNNGVISKATFENCVANLDGGCIYVNGNINVEISESEFIGNDAGDVNNAVYGGTVTNCSFVDRTAPENVTNTTLIETRTMIMVNVSNIYLGDSIEITSFVFNENNAPVTGNVDLYANFTFIGSEGNGNSFTFTPPQAGKYLIEARFGGDSNFKASAGNITVNVVPNIVVEIVPETIESDNEGVIILEFPDDATGTITVFIDGTQYKVYEIIGGILKIDLSHMNGKYTITFQYSGDDNYPAFKKDSEVSIQTNPSITASNAKVLYSAGTTYKITVYKNKGILAKSVSVTIKLNNKKLKPIKTNSKGVASFKVTQTPGTYKLKITTLGTTVTKTLTVKHIVTLKAVKVKKSAKKLILQATLAKVNKKYLKKKTVTFKFNGKTYKAKTNSKGVAKVTIKSSVLKKLKIGKKITYQATYLKDTVKKTTKVKK